jgi:hypothetical protein
MTKFKQSLLTAALALAISITLSCSDGGGGNSGSNPIKKEKITGTFQKGPFVEGIQATLNELDSELNPTGKPYQTLITDNKGTFELRNVELVSPYAHLIANGFYFNEVTGNKSSAPITLQAIVDVTDKDNINVNVLTHLEYYRVLDLVDGGMSVKAAKKQAQKEIFAVLGIDSDSFKDSEDMTIFGTSESDAALLAVSILLLGDLREADFTQRLMNFSQAIRNEGTWNNEEAKTAMADWASDKMIYKSGLEWATIHTNRGWDSLFIDFFIDRTPISCYYKQNDCWLMPTDDLCQTGVLVTDCNDANSTVEKIPDFYTTEMTEIKYNLIYNISGWGLSSDVPDFEKYINNYLAAR